MSQLAALDVDPALKHFVESMVAGFLDQVYKKTLLKGSCSRRHSRESNNA